MKIWRRSSWNWTKYFEIHNAQINHSIKRLDKNLQNVVHAIIKMLINKCPCGFVASIDFVTNQGITLTVFEEVLSSYLKESVIDVYGNAPKMLEEKILSFENMVVFYCINSLSMFVWYFVWYSLMFGEITNSMYLLQQLFHQQVCYASQSYLPLVNWFFDVT